MRTGQAFVSHTSDMAEYPGNRTFARAAMDGVVRAGMAPVDMQYFAARDVSPADYCRARVQDCEVYLAVVGFRYGSLVPGQAVSYTELEFEAASAAGLPRLVFLMEGIPEAAEGLADPDRGAVEGFRRRLRETGLIIRHFATADSLELEVFHALSELADDTAAVRTLPRDTASFTGREPELQDVADAAAGVGRLVNIRAVDGMAGIGKTAFAVHAAHLLTPQFPDGQIFLQLHGHTPGRRPVDPADALASLLLTVRVSASRIPAGLEARAALWRDRLAGRRVLLVLDDAANTEQVRPLLPGAAGSLVLITSRRRLTALEDAIAITLGVLPPGQAAELLVGLAGRRGLSPAETAVRDITRLCGHLPLAVGILARQLHHHPAWSPASLASDLAAARDRLELMVTENLSVAAAFDLSYLDLTPEEQRIFRRLSVHPGADFDVYAAAAVADVSLAQARSCLNALYDQHLLIEPARGRYRMHDLIRLHARALATGDLAADRDQCVERLLDYYQHTVAVSSAFLARQTRTRPVGTAVASPRREIPGFVDRAAALSWARTERANLVACLDYATQTGRHARVAGLTAAIAALLRQDGPWTDAANRHAIAVQAARHIGDPLTQADALNDLGTALYLTGDYAGAVAAAGEALGICRDLRYGLGQANALNTLGVVAYLTGDYRSAAQAQQEALDICREFGDHQGEAIALNYLGAVLRLAGNYSGAAEAVAESLAIHRDLGDRLGQAFSLNEAGALGRNTGNYAEALEMLAESRTIYHDLGDRQGEANALNETGVVRQLTGDYLGAEAALATALSLFRDLGARQGQANVLTHQGTLRRLTGDHHGADEALSKALSIYRDLGDRGGEAEVLNEMGTLHEADGDLDRAVSYHQLALDLARNIDAGWDEAHALAGLGRCALVAGRIPAARSSLRQAQEIFERIGASDAADMIAKLFASLEE